MKTLQSPQFLFDTENDNTIFSLRKQGKKIVEEIIILQPNLEILGYIIVSEKDLNVFYEDFE